VRSADEEVQVNRGFFNLLEHGRRGSGVHFGPGGPVMRNVIFAMFVFAVQLLGQTSETKKETAGDAWKPLQFLVGTWEAETIGGSSGATGSGRYAFRMELKNHVLVRRTIGNECKGPADFNCEHNDIVYIYADSPGGRLKAIFFDNEGHVIHYDVSVPHADCVIFSSDPAAPEPVYRLSYELKGKELFGKFEIRMPGKRDFTPYLEWSGGRK
jgi:hypothetical protein